MPGKDRPDGRRERANRTRRVFCGIARTTVRVALRNGLGFQEPGRLYVRCEERECQYADRNEPPCPLRVDMFRDRSDEVLRRYLADFGGAPVCYGCLAAALGFSHEQVRAAAWRLTVPGCRVDVRPMRCARCRARRLTIRLSDTGGTERMAGEPSGSVEETDDAADVAQTLMSAPGLALCGSCLAFTTHRALDEVRRIAATLSRDERFASVHAPCAACGRLQDVIAVAGAVAGA